MIEASASAVTLLKTGSSISTSYGATIEYNLNSMVEYIKATSTAADHIYTPAFKKLFPIDAIYKPFRPIYPGIKYYIYTTGNTDTERDSFEPLRKLNMGTLPRLYYPGPNMTYKYWLSPKDTNINISLEYFSNEAKTTVKLVPANKIIARFETSHDTPTSWVISVVKENNTVLSVPGTYINPSGEAIIYYNGTTWLAMTSDTPPPTNTTTEYLKKITLTAVNSNNGKLIGVIEFSPRWVLPVDSDIVSYYINKETTADINSVVPVGTITANYLNISILKPHDVNKKIIEYDRTKPIDKTKIYLFKNAIIEPYVYIGSISPTEKIKHGTFYMSTWTLSEFGGAAIDAMDCAKYLQDTMCPELLVQDCPITSVIKRILDSVGFSNYKIYVKETNNEVVDKTIPTINYWWCNGDKSVWDALQELCRDIQMNAFVDEKNILNFYSRDYLYDNSVQPSWTFTSEEIKTGSTVNYSPNIVSLDSKELFSGNEVKVRYQIAFVANSSDSSEPLWKSETSLLGAGSLATLIDDNSTDFKLDISTENTARTDKILQSLSGYLLINNEVIEYDGAYYQYVPKEQDTTEDPPVDKPPVIALIKNESDIWKHRNLAKVVTKPGVFNFFPTNAYSIKTRAALGTSKVNHPPSPDSNINNPGENNPKKFNSKDINLGDLGLVAEKARTGNYVPKGASKSFLQVSNTDKDQQTYTVVSKTFNSIDTVTTYLSAGTKMFFDSSIATEQQIGGMGFCLSNTLTSVDGYFLIIRTSAMAGRKKDIVIAKKKAGVVTVLKDSQSTASTTFSGIYTGKSYNIDILIKRQTVSGVTKNIITVFINGMKITAVDTGEPGQSYDTPPRSITNLLGLTCGQGSVYFQYIYGTSITEKQYNTSVRKQNFTNNGSYSDDTLSMLYGEILYKYGESKVDDTGSIVEFGTTAREIRKIKERFQDAGFPIQTRLGQNKSATVLAQRLQPFGVEAYILNNSTATVALEDGKYSSLYVLGNSITRSNPIDYNTYEGENSENKEFITFLSTWIQSQSDAEELAEWIKLNSLNKGRSINLTVFGNPLISAGDIVSINYPILEITPSDSKYIVTQCSTDYSEGMSTTVSCRAI